MGRHGLGLNVGLHGEEGKELREYWEEIGGPQSFKGVAVVSPFRRGRVRVKSVQLTEFSLALQPGFPNVFHVIGPNAICIAWGWTIGNQSTFIARLVKEVGSLAVMDSIRSEHID